MKFLFSLLFVESSTYLVFDVVDVNVVPVIFLYLSCFDSLFEGVDVGIDFVEKLIVLIFIELVF